MVIKLDTGQLADGLGPQNISAGGVDGWTHVHKFGAASVGTSFTPLCRGGVWQTPQSTGATTLRVKAGGNANDTAAGSGAREVMLQGLDETGALVEETLATAGASASSATSTTFMRLFRAWVSGSGTYANASSPSHSGDIVIENGSGGTDWATISSSGFARGQSEIGCYTVPAGYRAFVQNFTVQTDAAKSTDFLFYQRRNIMQTSTPYSSMRLLYESIGRAGTTNFQTHAPMGPFPAYTDLGFMAKVSTGTGEVVADFEILLQEA